MFLSDVTESRLIGQPHRHLTTECVFLQHSLSYTNQSKALVTNDRHHMAIITYIRLNTVGRGLERNIGGVIGRVPERCGGEETTGPPPVVSV